MSINVGIIDQRVLKLAENLPIELDTRLSIRNDEVKQRSAAFIFLEEAFRRRREKYHF